MALSLAIGFAATMAQAASPRLNKIMPRGVQRGSEHVLRFRGQNLFDTQEVFFYGADAAAGKIEVTKLDASPNKVTVTIKVADDCRLGEHVAQLRTATGISDFRTFWVEALKEVKEKEPNSEFATPQAIPMNVVVAGKIENEDVDYFVVEAKKGERISVEVVAMRLASAMFDPRVAILDTKRFELAANDDTALALQDAFAAIIAPEDGNYLIEVRESAYAAGSDYRLHVGNYPRPTIAFPAGGKLGETVDVQMLGLPGGPLLRTLSLPIEPNDEYGLFTSDEGGISPTPNTFRLSSFGNAFEQEPNNERSQATQVELPQALNGVLESPGDTDFYRFAVKKNRNYEIECYARRVRSPLDPVMTLLQPDGKFLVDNDDSRGPDSYFRWKAPADGEVVLQIKDHLGSGGPEFVYRVEVTNIQPSLTLGIPRAQQFQQYRQQIFVPRGNRFATRLLARRQGFGGPIKLDELDLPTGITIHAAEMSKDVSDMAVVFEASDDAPLGGKLLNLTASLVDPKRKITGHFENTADLVRAEPNNTVYRAKTVERLAIAVVDKLPFKIEIFEPKSPLVRVGSKQLKVVAHRDEGFDQPIRVELPYRPPGVGAQGSVVIPKGKNEVFYPINANGKARLGEWQIFAIGRTNIKGLAWASSQLTTLSVADRYVTFKMPSVACEQGKPVELFCELNHLKPFAGKATAEIFGLPPHISPPAVQEFTSETKELRFPLETSDKTPVGKHKGVFCQVTIIEQGEPVVHRAATTELQIDKPLPKPTEKPKPATSKESEPEIKKSPAIKPLSRLEKLRLEAKDRK